MQLTSTILATALTLAMSQLAEIRRDQGRQRRRLQTSADRARHAVREGERQQARHHLSTVGQHIALIRDGEEEFDVAVLTPDAIDDLAKDGKIVPGTRADLAGSASVSWSRQRRTAARHQHCRCL